MAPSAGDIDEGDGLVDPGQSSSTPVGPKVRRAQQSKDGADEMRRVYLAIHRVLWFLAIDRRAFEVMVNGEDEASVLAGLKKNDEIREKLLDDSAGHLRGDALKLREFMKSVAANRQHGSPGPKLGAAHTEQLSDQHPAGGLAWWYAIAQELPESVAPSGRFEMVLWALSKSAQDDETTPSQQLLDELRARASPPHVEDQSDGQTAQPSSIPQHSASTSRAKDMVEGQDADGSLLDYSE